MFMERLVYASRPVEDSLALVREYQSLFQDNNRMQGLSGILVCDPQCH